MQKRSRDQERCKEFFPSPGLLPHPCLRPGAARRPPSPPCAATQRPGRRRPRPLPSASGLSPVIRCRGVRGSGSPRAGPILWAAPAPTPAGPPVLLRRVPVLVTPWSPSVTTRCTSRPCRCRRAPSWRETRAGTGRCPAAIISTWGRLSASCWCCAAGAARAPTPEEALVPEGPGQNWPPPWPPWPRSAPEVECRGAVAPATRIPSPREEGIPEVEGVCSEAAAPFSPMARALLPQGERPR